MRIHNDDCETIHSGCGIDQSADRGLNFALALSDTLGRCVFLLAAFSQIDQVRYDNLQRESRGNSG